MQFEQALLQLRAGQLTYREFLALTSTRWQALASLIARKWRMPGWTSLKDIEQWLHAGAYKAVWKWDPIYKVSIVRYVTYNAMDLAKKEMHKCRGAAYGGRGVDFNPSRLEIPFSTYERDDDTHVPVTKTEATQFDSAVKKEAIRRALDACSNVREVLTVQALAQTESIAGAAELLYEDADARLRCRFSCERHARIVVERAAVSVARKLG